MRFSLLGPLEVLTGDTQLEVAGRKQQLILTALILARANVVSADRLITLIWGDQLPTKPSQTLRSYVSHLRRTLDPERQAGARSGLLVTKSPGYLLDTASANVDVFDFENRSTRADRYLAVGRFEATFAETTGAIDLWRSDDLVDSPLVHFSGERERLVELRLHTVGVGFDAMLGAGRHREAIPDLRRLVEREPLREHPRSQLMLALHRSGRSAEAVDVYHAGHRILIEETGFDPSTLLRELEARILANDPDLDWRGPEPLGDTNRDRSIASIETAPSAWSVGREKEVALIVDAISPPVGELVVMTGEPGIGKTRLAELAAGQAGERGMLSAWGHCYQGARSATLAPWRAALAMMTEHLDDHCLHDLGYLRAAQLGQLVPELAARVGVEPIETGDPQALQEAIVQFIRHLIKEQPLLLCFEDLHWADPASVWLLVHLLPQVRGLPFATVATWRDTDPTSDELQTALVELAKQGPDHRLRLTGFDVDAVADLWAGIRGQPGSPSAVAELQARTEGNPLFVTELLRPPIGAPPEMSPAPSAQLSAAVSTTTINDVIEARLAQLPEGCDELLTICALSPDSATPELLSQVLGQDGDHVIDQIDSLLAAGLIVDMSPPAPTLKVRHSVIADNLTGRLSEARKAQLHTQIAESLRQLKAPAGPLAHHFLSGLAQDPKVVAQAALDAAVDSSALHDHLGAIDLVERGLSALKRDDDDLLRARLMIVLAVEHKHQEHFNQAHSAALEGFALARRQGDLDLMVAATMVFCGFRAADVHYGVEWLGYWNPPGPALEILDVCLDELGPCHQRVFCLVARADQFIGDYFDEDDLFATLDEAVALARKLDDPVLLSTTLRHDLLARERYLSVAERRELLDEGLAAVGSEMHPQRELVGNRDAFVLCLDEEDLDAAVAHVDGAITCTRGTDDPTLEMLAESMSIALDLYQGNFDEVEAALHGTMARFGGVGNAALDLFGIQLAVLQRERGELAEVESLLQWKLSGYPSGAYGIPLALVMAEQGNEEGARVVLDEFGSTSSTMRSETVVQFMTPAFATELAVTLDDREMAAMLYPAMAMAAGRTVAMFSGIAMFGSGSYYLGRLATMLGLYDDAHAHLLLAERQHRSAAAKPYLLRGELARAELAGLVDRDRAGLEHLERAERLGAELGMDWFVAAHRLRVATSRR